MTLYEASECGKKVRITFKDGSTPLTGMIDFMMYAKDTDDGRAWAAIDRFEIYEDEIESIELAESE